MLARADISELWRQRTTKYAVQCVQHDYTPNSTIKFLNQPQTPYPKKNWSSMMLFNNAKCTTLTPDYVNSATGLELHQYKWLENEELIGKIDEKWNWLVGEYEYNSNAKLRPVCPPTVGKTASGFSLAITDSKYSLVNGSI